MDLVRVQVIQSARCQSNLAKPCRGLLARRRENVDAPFHRDGAHARTRRATYLRHAAHTPSSDARARARQPGRRLAGALSSLRFHRGEGDTPCTDSSLLLYEPPRSREPLRACASAGGIAGGTAGRR